MAEGGRLGKTNGAGVEFVTDRALSSRFQVAACFYSVIKSNETKHLARTQIENIMSL